MSRLLALGFILFLAASALAAGGYYHLSKDLPALYSLRSYRPPIITRVYADDGTLIAEFAEQRRILASPDQIPEHVKLALVAAEDARFYEHPGIDWWRILGALWKDIRHLRIKEGASTISMQVARTFFLTREVNIERKLKEAILAVRIERYLSKDDILYLYLSQVDFGESCHGVAAAGEFYFGKPVHELSLAEGAMLAGLLPAPYRYNPLRNFELAQRRQRYVLQAMRTNGMITDEEEREALAEPIKVTGRRGPQGEAAPYFTEHVRRLLVERYGWDAVYREGLIVFTTVNLEADRVAADALNAEILGPGGIDRGLGYRGPVGRLEGDSVKPALEKQEQKRRRQWLADFRRESLARGEGEPDSVNPPDPVPLTLGETYRAIVASVDDGKSEVWVLTGRQRGRIVKKDMAWAGKYQPGQSDARLKKPSEILQPGDLILARALSEDKDEKGGAFYRMALEQTPVIQGGLIAMSARTGHVKALAGGLDYRTSQFIRPIQAKRQPGSAFKPVVYAAAFDHVDERGNRPYTPATIIYDAPMVFEKGSASCGVVIREAYRPRNYNRTFSGPQTLQKAVALSINTIAVRVGWNICLDYVTEYARRLGIKSRLDRLPCLPLGCSEITLEELTTAFNVFASGGNLLEPIYLLRVYDRDGNLLEYEPLLPPAGEPEIQAETAPASAGDDGFSGRLTEEDLLEEEPLFTVKGVTHLLLSRPTPPQQLAEPTWEEFLARLQQPDRDWLPTVNTPAAGRRVINPQTAYLVNYLLRTVITDGTAMRARRLGRPLAGKTGTTNDARDALFIGYSPELTAGVWVGPDEYAYSLGKGVTGGKAALPVWMAFMEKTVGGRPAVKFPTPPGIEWARIDTQTGLRASEFTPSDRIRTYPFIKGTAPLQATEPRPELPGGPASNSLPGTEVHTLIELDQN